jgi:hypothetical protein
VTTVLQYVINVKFFLLPLANRFYRVLPGTNKLMSRELPGHCRGLAEVFAVVGCLKSKVL